MVPPTIKRPFPGFFGADLGVAGEAHRWGTRQRERILLGDFRILMEPRAKMDAVSLLVDSCQEHRPRAEVSASAPTSPRPTFGTGNRRSVLPIPVEQEPSGEAWALGRVQTNRRPRRPRPAGHQRQRDPEFCSPDVPLPPAHLQLALGRRRRLRRDADAPHRALLPRHPPALHPRRHEGPPEGHRLHPDAGRTREVGINRARLPTIESFWSTLKLELVNRRLFDNHREARPEIFDSIEFFYNRQRRHTSLGGLSTAHFEVEND